MNKNDYPVFTVIMRHYSLEQSKILVKVMQEFKDFFCVEVTLNTKDALQIIAELTNEFGENVKIGAGTVRNLDEAKQAVEAGAKFILSPHKLSSEVFDYCKENNVVSVPAGMTPSEISESFDNGADIVKVFPAAVVQSRFFKDVQGPLGKVPLMAVGGVSPSNAREFLDNGASYLGFGSNLFSAEELETLDESKIRNVYEKLVNILE